ncbi:nucleotidyltransferase domain-containing protein [Candidatus Micrarchaeota archaeon]|nr:nucleotidyltransferase domain-containing protein [Candidatus Micrarchaeota archaeon]
MELNDYAILRAMQTVLIQPLKKFSIVELAKQSKLAPSAAKYTLDYMLKTALVTDERVGQVHQYQANLEYYLTRQWKVLFSLEELQDAKIIENILEQSKSITSILLYGSCAQGTDDELSDFDILVIADVDWKKKKNITSQAHGTTREPNITVYTPLEWRKKAEKNKAFYENVIIHSIVLYGQKPVVL